MKLLKTILADNNCFSKEPRTLQKASFDSTKLFHTAKFLNIVNSRTWHNSDKLYISS